MSTASLGAHRVGEVVAELTALGYRVAQLAGQHRTIRGDVIALSRSHGYPHVLIAVGGASRRLTAVFAELRGSSVPGCAPLVARFIRPAARWFYVSEDQRFAELVDALDALRGLE